ncbi:MAG: hypothetical protein NTX15_04090 [Candidatus Kapabacteria bacterium]|nr:hypothetical protein [Candidatus Kapabacteria bacterium]
MTLPTSIIDENPDPAMMAAFIGSFQRLHSRTAPCRTAIRGSVWSIKGITQDTNPVGAS